MKVGQKVRESGARRGFRELRVVVASVVDSKGHLCCSLRRDRLRRMCDGT